MIETKEQYEALREEADQYAAQDSDFSWQNAILTIEALRGIAARAIKARNLMKDTPELPVDMPEEALELDRAFSDAFNLLDNMPKIPDWITDG